MLERARQRLGVDGNVIFHNRFVSQAELVEFLAAADIYITPYLNPEQITSGTLAYALGAGKAVISTPYRYARELLADGRGILVPWRIRQAIATRDRRAARRRRRSGSRSASAPPRTGGHGSGPPSRGRICERFERARAEHAQRLRTAFQAQDARDAACRAARGQSRARRAR